MVENGGRVCRAPSRSVVPRLLPPSPGPSPRTHLSPLLSLPLSPLPFAPVSAARHLFLSICHLSFACSPSHFLLVELGRALGRHSEALSPLPRSAIPPHSLLPQTLSQEHRALGRDEMVPTCLISQQGNSPAQLPGSHTARLRTQRPWHPEGPRP